VKLCSRWWWFLLVWFAGASSPRSQFWAWQPATLHPPTDGSARLAFDPLRQRLVAVVDDLRWGPGRFSTWEWNGGRWFRVASRSGDPVGQQATAWDPSRNAVVRIDAAGLTWALVDGGWQQQPIAAVTTAVSDLAFDPARNRLVALFGSQVCELASGVWAPRATIPGGMLSGARIGFEPLGGQMLVFGGSGAAMSNATWSWNGTSLTQLMVANPPPPRVDHALVHDVANDELLLIGGIDPTLSGGTRYASVHAWDGTGWAARPGLSSPRHDFGTTMASRGVLVWGGEGWMGTGARRSAELLLREPGGTFTALTMLSAGPAAAHDPVRARTVSTRDTRTIEWDGYVWRDVRIAAPAGVVAMAWHAGLGRLFAFTDTAMSWTFDGAIWQPAAATATPPARIRTALAHDPVRNRMVLFGGLTGAGIALNDVWEWDGTGWTQPMPMLAPPAGVAGLAWEVLGARMVAIANGGGVWVWDGATWVLQNVPPLTNFVANSWRATTFSGAVVVLAVANVGPGWPGYDVVNALTGSHWRRLTTPGSGPTSGSFVVDTNRNELMVHESVDAADYVRAHHEPDIYPIGTACGGSGGLPLIRPISLTKYGSFAVTDAYRLAGSSFAFLLASVISGSTPLPGGCVLTPTDPIVFAWSPTTPTGFATFAWSVPTEAAVRGVVVYEQVLTLDPSGAFAGVASLSEAVFRILSD
jgi:hypothetical protein